MKTLFIAGVAVLLVVSSALAQPQKKGFTATTGGPKNQNALKPPPVTNRGEMGGVVPRMFQGGGNPLQMFNPKAPARYGTAAQAVAIDPDTGKLNGIKLFEFVF